MSNLKEKFGQKLTRLRKAQGFTQEALASAAGVTIETISNIERGIHGPRFDLLEALADHLGVDVKTLFDFKQD